MKNQNTKATQNTKAKGELTMKNAPARIENQAKVNTAYSAIYEEFKKAECKADLVDSLNRHGIRTNTQPTLTKNKNDLYIQFYDKSRLLITSKSLKVYTSEDHAKALGADKDFYFDPVSDGSYRVKRATVSNTEEHFNTIFAYFEKAGCLAKLPELAK